MRTPGALGLSVGDPRPSRCPARSRTSRFRRRWGRAGPTPCGTLQGTALGLRTPGHVKVRAPPGQTLSAWRPRPNAKRGWGSAAPAQGVPRTTPDSRGPRSSPVQRWEGVPAAPFFLRHPHSGPPHLRPGAPGPSTSLGTRPHPLRPNRPVPGPALRGGGKESGPRLSGYRATAPPAPRKGVEAAERTGAGAPEPPTAAPAGSLRARPPSAGSLYGVPTPGGGGEAKPRGGARG